MGFFDAIGTVLDRVVPAATALVTTGNPIAAVTTLAGVERAKRQEKVLERQQMAIGDPSLSGNMFLPKTGGFNPVQEAGFFAPGGTLRTGLRDFGGFLSDFSPVANIFGLGDRFQQQAPPAAQTVITQPPTETASSGEITGASLGIAAPLVQAARGFARSPGGQAVFGGGAGLAVGALSGGGNGQPRITRKMKSDVRKIYMMAGMDPNATAQILNNLGTYPRMNFDASLVFFILTKRFRNDGPVVTKAAVRKTKTTLRRMKGVVDMYNSVCKPTTRRAPARRAAPKAVQLIKN